jgi:AraC-like DNA-binding protein
MPQFLNILILLGTLQGLIVSPVLFFSKQNKLANRLLAFFILLISLALLKLYCSANNWFGFPLFNVLSYFIPLVVVMPLGPLLYFYVQASVNPQFKFNKKDNKHFYTILIDFIPSLTTLVFFIGVNTNLIANNPDSWGLFVDTYNVYADIPRWVSLAIYIWLSFQLIKQNKAYDTKVLNMDLQIKWLKQLIVAIGLFTAVWVVYLIPYIIPSLSNWLLTTLNWYPIYLPMVILIYWLGIKVFLNQSVRNPKTSIPSNPLAQETITKTLALLTKAMETDKLFLNPELNVSVLAQKIAIPQKTISAVLNQHLNKNFNEFVNDYRLQEFKIKITQPHLQNLTILGIATECGFNSQATFQRIFKEAEGVSPSVFVKNIQKGI